MFDQIPWRAKLAVGGLTGLLGGFLLAGFFTGSYRTWPEVRVPLLVAVLTGLFSHQGLRRSPAVVRARLKELFRDSAEPDLVKINEVLSETGHSELFAGHRNTVDRFMRGMITKGEFYGAMRALVDEG